MEEFLGIPVLLTVLIRLITFCLVFGGIFFLLRYYLKHSRPRIEAGEKGKEVSTVLLPLRLQAFERMVLFLERIHPANLVMRLNDPALPAVTLQSMMVQVVREEFEYNLSQQLYIPSYLWERIRNAREESVALINQVAAGLAPGSSSQELVRELLNAVVSRGKLPVDVALDEIRQEVQKMF